MSDVPEASALLLRLDERNFCYLLQICLRFSSMIGSAQHGTEFAPIPCDEVMDSTEEPRDLLRQLGLTEEQLTDFFAHISVVYSLPTQSDPGIGLIHLVNDSRLRNGIVEINDVGGGLKSFGQLRARTIALAKVIGISEVELFGASLINEKLERLLSRRGFERRVELIPDSLGNHGTMETYSKSYAVASEEG